MARNTTKTLKETTAPAVSLADLVAGWTDTADKASTSLADLAAAFIKAYDLTLADVAFLSRPKTAEEKASNRHTTVGYALHNLVEENIVVKGQRILPETVAKIRDKNVERSTVVQGLPLSSTGTAKGKTSWNGQISTRINQLRLAIKETLGAKTERSEKEMLDYIMGKFQDVYNKVNKAETFDLADLAAFNAELTKAATMIGGKLKAVK